MFANHSLGSCQSTDKRLPKAHQPCGLADFPSDRCRQYPCQRSNRHPHALSVRCFCPLQVGQFGMVTRSSTVDPYGQRGIQVKFQVEHMTTNFRQIIPLGIKKNFLIRVLAFAPSGGSPGRSFKFLEASSCFRSIFLKATNNGSLIHGCIDSP